MRTSTARIIIALLLAHAHARVAAADCKDDASAFEAYMRGLDRGFEIAVIADDTTLVARKDLTATPHALQINLTSVGINVDLTRVELSRLHNVLAARAKLQAEPDWQRLTPGWAGHYQDVVLAIDESVPWSEVVTVAGLAHRAGFAHAYFMFARAEQAVPPPHTAIDDAVKDAKTQSVRATVLEPARRAFDASCPALEKAWQVVPRSNASWYRDTFVPGFGRALVACDCKVDLAELRSWMFYRLTPVVQTGSLEVELAKTGKTLALSGKTPWREASKKLVAGAVWPVAR